MLGIVLAALGVGYLVTQSGSGSTHKGARAPARGAGSGGAPSGGGGGMGDGGDSMGFPSYSGGSMSDGGDASGAGGDGGSGGNDGGDLFGSSGASTPASSSSTNAASLGLSDDEFANLTNTMGATNSDAASLGLSDDEFANMTNTGTPAGAAPSTFDGAEGTGGGSDGSGGGGGGGAEGTGDGGSPFDTSGNASDGSGAGSDTDAATFASDNASLPSSTDDNSGGSTDDGSGGSTDDNSNGPSLPTSVSGYVGADLDSAGAPPNWTDNQDGTATDPTNTYTFDYGTAWMYYNLWNQAPVGTMQNDDNGVSLPATTTSGYVGADLDSGAPPNWYDNQDGTATDPTNTYTFPYEKAWMYYNLWNQAPAGTLQNDDNGVSLPTPVSADPFFVGTATTGAPLYGFGEVHARTGAPIVRDSSNTPWMVTPEGHLKRAA